jgi:putative DNA methylase
VQRYGQWMREEAHKRVGHLYPPIEITAGMAQDFPDLKLLVGQKLTVIAWIWARTVKSPNPAFRHVDVPLVSSFVLAQKPGKEAWLRPVVSGNSYEFEVCTGPIPVAARTGTKAESKGTFRCILSSAAISSDYIKTEAAAGRMNVRLLAVVAGGDRRRIYLPPMREQEGTAITAVPGWIPDLSFAHNSRHLTPWAYGLDNFGSLFTHRQLAMLATLADLVGEARSIVEANASAAGVDHPKVYADTVAMYLAIFVSRMANLNNAMCQWRSDPAKEHVGHMFARQAIPMVWDFAEANPFGGSAGDFEKTFDFIPKVLPLLPAKGVGKAMQADAQTQMHSHMRVVSTDPPYYDNVPYADLSDFFYVWLRRSMRLIEPELFATIAVPKGEELVADALRHKGKPAAERFFLKGMTEAMRRLAADTHPAVPITIYYAFKQSETKASSGTSSSGWETFLEAMLSSGLAISGTWPVRTELGNRMRSSESNALASSIVLVCRPRPATAETISRRAFLRELNQYLPEALDEMTRGSGDDQSPVAPVDLSQAIIGPGMAVFSKYAAVLEADGTPMTVQTALRLINRFLAEDDFDPDTQFCLHWFEQHGWGNGRFGDADTLTRAKGTSVDGVKQSGVIHAAGGIVRLLKWADYPGDWKPETGFRLPIWEVLHQLIRVFRTQGESGAGAVLAAVAPKVEATRQLAYRLYTLCERAGWAEDARAYNEIITSWSAIESVAARAATPKQASLFEA